MKVMVPDGMVLGVNRNDPQDVLWKYKVLPARQFRFFDVSGRCHSSFALLPFIV